VRSKYGRFVVIVLISVIAIIAAITMGLLIRPSKGSSSTTIISKYSPELRWNSTGITILGKTGTNISFSEKLSLPYGIAFDLFGDLYVADYYHNRTQKILMKTLQVVTVAGQANGSMGSGSYGLFYPTHMAFDSNNNMYVMDTANRRVQFFTQGNLSGSTVAGALSWGTAIAYDSDNHVLYAADGAYNRIMKYSYGTSVSISIAAGSNGCGLNTSQICSPQGLYFDKYTNSLLISSTEVHAVVRWRLGDSNWTNTIAGSPNGTRGNTSTTLNRPWGIILDPMGNYYISDRDNNRIQFFLNGQSVGRTIAGITGLYGTNPLLLFCPYWMALDKQLNLYVADACNHRIQLFKRY